MEKKISRLPRLKLDPYNHRKPLSAGLIGCGDVALRYAAALDGTVEGLKLRTVWDIDRNVGADFAERFGVELTMSFKEFLSHPFDLICVCTPNSTHSTVATTCLEAGFDVLVEHPLAISITEGERLCRLSAQCERHLFVVRQRRFLRSVQLLRAVLVRELLGRIKKVKAIMVWNRRLDYFKARPWRMSRENGGVVLNQASHLLDILLYLFGVPSLVEGTMGNLRNDLPVEDSAQGTIAFHNGIAVEFVGTTAAPLGCNWTQLTVTGTKGKIVLYGEAWERIATTINNAVVSALTRTLEGPLSGDHAGFIQRVALLLSGEEVEVVDAEEGMNAVRLINHIYKNFQRDSAALRKYFQPLLNGDRDDRGCP